MSHARRVPPSVYGRLLLVQRVAAGRPAAHVAAELGVSRATAYKWPTRFAAEGEPGLLDRSSRPHHSSARTPAGVERKVLALRHSRRLGPARIGGILGLHPSTVHRVLTRHQVARLAWLDRPTGVLIRRYERDRPGDLVHVDVKKLGRIPVGGGWRGRRDRGQFTDVGRRVGYAYVHSAVDDHSRVAYSEVPTTRRPRPPPRSPLAPWPCSPPAASACGGAAHRQRLLGLPQPRLRRLRAAGSATASSSPTVPRPTARSNGSTAPCSRSGPTPAVHLGRSRTRRPCTLPPHLQPSPPPHRSRPPPTDHPRHPRPRSLQLERHFGAVSPPGQPGPSVTGARVLPPPFWVGTVRP